MMLEKLTDEQVATFPSFVDRWVQIGLSVERTDRIKAEESVKKVYEMAGLTPPKEIVWFPSPLEGMLAASKLPKTKHPQVMDQVRNQVWDQVMDQVRNQV